MKFLDVLIKFAGFTFQWLMAGIIIGSIYFSYLDHDYKESIAWGMALVFFFESIIYYKAKNKAQHRCSLLMGDLEYLGKQKNHSVKKNLDN